MCHHHPQANVDATEEEWEAYQYVLATPRSDAR